jgi:hypothetical protein
LTRSAVGRTVDPGRVESLRPFIRPLITRMVQFFRTRVDPARAQRPSADGHELCFLFQFFDAAMQIAAFYADGFRRLGDIVFVFEELMLDKLLFKCQFGGF